MRAWSFFVLPAFALVALQGAPASAQNASGMLTPFSTPQAPVFSATGGSGGGNRGGGHHGGGDGGDFHHHHGENFPAAVFPWWIGPVDVLETPDIQSLPVNTAPFAPPSPPGPASSGSPKPYKPPSVEIAPGGIEIIRGPG